MGQPGRDETILVVGATGVLGSAICRGLRGKGYSTRALTRPASPNAEQLRVLGCEVVLGDLKDEHSLALACQGVTTVITTANAAMSRRPEDSLKSVDRNGSLRLVDVARACGVGRFIYTSLSPNLPADNLFVRSKREVERAVSSSGMTWTILQPTAFMEIHAGSVAGWDYVRGRARILGSGRAPVSYVSVSDVAAFAVESVSNPFAANRSLHIAGPEPISALDAVRIAERVTGRTFKVQRMPTVVLGALAAVLGPFNPTLASLLKMGASMDRGDVADMAPLLREMPIRQTTFEQYVRQTLRPASPTV